MSVFGALALLVNVSAALVMAPHRRGDASVRALFLWSAGSLLQDARQELRES